MTGFEKVSHAFGQWPERKGTTHYKERWKGGQYPMKEAASGGSGAASGSLK
jgi:hypothetical protein